MNRFTVGKEMAIEYGYNAGANKNCDDGELSKESEEGEKESDKFNMGLGQMEETKCQYGSLPQVNLRSGKKSDQYQKENKYKYTSVYTHTNKAQPKASQVSEKTGEDTQYLYIKNVYSGHKRSIPGGVRGVMVVIRYVFS